jgi:hypothetical protein
MRKAHAAAWCGIESEEEKTMTGKPFASNPGRTIAVWERCVRWTAVAATATFLVVVATQFCYSWNAAEAARAAALSAWAQGDNTRADVVERYKACSTGVSATVHECAQRTGSAALPELVELATRQASAHAPAPLSWFVVVRGHRE